MLLRLVGSGIVNTVFKYSMIYMQLAFIIVTFELLTKICAKFYLLFVNIQHAYSVFALLGWLLL